MNLIQRIFCAIFGHQWMPAGWLGGLKLNDDMMLCWNCERCNFFIYSIELAWHYKARFHSATAKEINTIKRPDRFNGGSGDYSDHLDYLNNNYPIDILAEIHSATIEELKKLGYN